MTQFREDALKISSLKAYSIYDELDREMLDNDILDEISGLLMKVLRDNKFTFNVRLSPLIEAKVGNITTIRRFLLIQRSTAEKTE